MPLVFPTKRRTPIPANPILAGSLLPGHGVGSARSYRASTDRCNASIGWTPPLVRSYTEPYSEPGNILKEKVLLMCTRVASIVAFALLLAVATPLPAADTAQDGVLIHITAGPDDPHRVLMALRMAELMSTDHPTVVYMDIDAVHVALKGATPLQHEPFADSATLLQKLIDNGVRIMACPGCLEAAGKSPEDLRKGISVAEKSAFFDFTDGRILTLDY